MSLLRAHIWVWIEIQAAEAHIFGPCLLPILNPRFPIPSLQIFPWAEHPWISPFTAGDDRMPSTSGMKWSRWILSIHPWPWRSRQNFGPWEPNETNRWVETAESQVDFSDVAVFLPGCWFCPAIFLLVVSGGCRPRRFRPRVVRNDPRINWTAKRCECV